MTKEDVMQVLRMTAMGRIHPLHEEFAEKLAKLLETPEQRADSDMAEAGIKRTRKKAD